MYELLMGKDACTMNLHSYNHLPGWRDRHRLKDLSAEPAESYYGQCRASFCETAASPGKQIHYNMCACHLLDHMCHPRFYHAPYQGPGKQDHIVVDRNMHCYKLIRSNNNNTMTVRRYLCAAYKTEDEFNLDWSSVGVFVVKGICREEQELFKKDIRGKGIIVGGTLYVWSRDLQDM